MALSLINNVASLTAQNNLSRTSSALSTSLQRLSSGLKINSGADGPAALVVSEHLRAQIGGLQTALDNTNKAVSLVQTGEGALNEINSLLTQARSLALDSANAGVNDTNTFQANQAQLSNILSTIDKIANSTQFNGKNLLDGTGGSGTLSTTQAGAAFAGSAVAALGSTSYTINVTTAAAKAQVVGGAFPNATLQSGDEGTITLGYGNSAANVTLAIGDNVDAVVGKINTALNKAGVTGITASDNGGKLQIDANDYNSDISVGGNAATLTALGLDSGSITNTAHVDAVATYQDTAGNTVTVNGTGNTLNLTGELAGISLTLTGAANAVGNFTATPNTGFVFQIGANAGAVNQATVNFQKATTDSLGHVGSNYLVNADVSTAANANTALGLIDQAISDVSNFRGRLGAFQANTLQANANNLQTTLQNTTAAESTIRDTDYASEIANFSKLQVQLQAGQTVLSNANQIPSSIAQLLRG
jgi:flagellin